MNMQQFSAEFQAFINQFATNKGNDLQFSNSFMPKRAEIYVLDISTARDASNPLEIKVPFNSVHLEAVYSTATPTTAKSGSIKISFDYADIANISNGKTLNPNDAFTINKEASKCYLTWSAQSDTTVRIAFLTDIEFRPGATQSTITSGTVTTTSTSKYPAPSLVTNVESQNASATETYTVPAGKYAIVSGMAYAVTGYGLVEVSNDGTDFINAAFGVDNSKVANSFNRWYIPAGGKIRASSADVSSSAQALIEVYDL